MATDTAAPARVAAAPTPAYTREYLRGGLPAVYGEPADDEGTAPFAMRFLGALENVLDPIVAMLDLLPAHLDLRIAPDDIVLVLGTWLGLEFDRALDADARRRLTLDATTITRTRGTVSGIRHVLELAFPEVPGVDVEDSGGVTYGEELPKEVPPEDGPAILISCPAAAPPEKRKAIRRVVEGLKPLGTRVVMTSRAEATR
jgi:phage tail-like protein